MPLRRTSRLNPAAQQVTRNVLARFLGGSMPDPTPLALSFVNPASGATVSGNVTVSLSSSGGSGSGYSYRVSVDGTPVYAGTNPSFTWNTTSSPDGSYTLTAEVTNSAGATATASRTVTVSNAPSASFTASFSNPSADGATVRNNLSVGMATTAPWGQSKTWALSVDGTALTPQTTTGTVLWYTLNTTTLPNGQHTLMVRVTYNGATATATRLITVAN